MELTALDRKQFNQLKTARNKHIPPTDSMDGKRLTKMGAKYLELVKSRKAITTSEAAAFMGHSIENSRLQLSKLVKLGYCSSHAAPGAALNAPKTYTIKEEGE